MVFSYAVFISPIDPHEAGTHYNGFFSNLTILDWKIGTNPGPGKGFTIVISWYQVIAFI